MADEVYGWDNLSDDPKGMDGKTVNLEGTIVGSFIERLGTSPGVQTVISPHSSESRLAPLVDDMDAKVIVFLPGNLSETEMQTLRHMKIQGSCLYVQGKFEYIGGANGHIGRLEADSYQSATDQ